MTAAVVTAVVVVWTIRCGRGSSGGGGGGERRRGNWWTVEGESEWGEVNEVGASGDMSVSRSVVAGG